VSGMDIESTPNCGVRQEAGQSMPRKLNLGCGNRKLDDHVNVDLSPSVQPDLLWDLNRFPYPLPHDHFEHIRAFDVVEHLQDIPAFIAHVHQLLAPGGTIEITTPHYSCANSYTDPTHRFHLGYFSFDYFTRGHELSYYSDAAFEIVERKIYFNKSLFSRLLFHVANRYPAWYERRAAWIFPAWFMGFRLRALK
jgi:SAM-dependent methyltransferase